MPTRSNKALEKPNANDEESTDGRGGVRFGTGIAYDDAYAGPVSAGGDDDYVSALPTLDEERKMMADDEDIRAKEREEFDDAGRVGGGMHPSTMASSKVSIVVFVCVL